MDHDARDEAAQQAQQQQELASGQANWGAGAGKKAGLATPQDAGQDAEMEDAAGDGEPGSQSDEGEQDGEGEGTEGREAAGDSFLTAKLAAARLEDEGPSEAWEVGDRDGLQGAQAGRKPGQMGPGMTGQLASTKTA